MIPWLRLAIVAAVLAGAFGSGWQVRDWQADAANLARQQAESKDALRRAEIAARSAQQFEEVRDAIRSELRAAAPRVATALAAPACPASAPVAVGDVVLPAGALDRVRIAAGEFSPADDPAEPGPAVRPGAGAPGR